MTLRDLREEKSSRLVTVLVINWNGAHVLEECLQGLRAQSFPDYSVIVVDNGSTDGSLELLHDHHPDVKVIALPRNEGFARANNIVLKGLTTPYVALVNNDVLLAPNWLQVMVHALNGHPQAWAAACKMVSAFCPHIVDRAGDAYTIEGAGLLRGRGERAQDYAKREWVFGACAGASLYRTKVFQELGFFDEDFFLLYEDVDLSFRAVLRGYRCLYVPEAVALHRVSYSVGRDSALSVYYGQRNLEWVYVKNMPLSLLALTLPLHIIYNIGAGLYLARKGRGREFLRAKVSALRGLPTMMQKRKKVQSRRIVNARTLWSFLTKDVLKRRYALKRRYLNT